MSLAGIKIKGVRLAAGQVVRLESFNSHGCMQLVSEDTCVQQADEEQARPLALVLEGRVCVPCGWEKPVMQPHRLALRMCLCCTCG